MATYKVWLTVKDRYGTTKELNAGSIDVELNDLETNEVNVIDAHFATDAELTGAIKNNETIRYADFEIKE